MSYYTFRNRLPPWQYLALLALLALLLYLRSIG
jgi:hypothetical protein